MNIPKIAYELGKVNPKYLDEVMNYKRKKAQLRLKTVLLAAVIAIFFCGVTVFAEVTGLFGLKQLFGYLSQNYSDVNMPFMEDSGTYGTEVRVSASAGGLNVNLTNIACGEHYAAAVIEVDASQYGEIPDGILPQFRWYNDNCDPGTVGMTLLSHEGSIYTYGYYDRGFSGTAENGFVLELEEFGYYPAGKNGYDDFVVLVWDSIYLEVPGDSINILKSVKAKEPQNVDGLEIEMELSPLGVMLTFDYATANRMGVFSDKQFESVNKIELFMRDGRHVGDGESYESVYRLICSQNGWIDRKNNKYYHTYFGFSAPLDISQIESVAFHGVTFEFDTEVEYD